MIIECPACSTRYDIKVDLPPDGRTVRCAKCENVWRAVPLVEEEPYGETYAAGEAYGQAGDEGTDVEADARQHGGGWGPEVADEEEEVEAPAFLHGFRQAPQIQEEEEVEMPAFLHGFHRAAEMQEDEAPHAEAYGFSSAALSSAMEKSGEEAPAIHEEGRGKVSWFGGFMRKNQKQAPAAQAGFSHREPEPMPEPEPEFMPEAEPEPEPAAADPLPFPRPGPAFAPQTVDHNVRSLSDARAAVRNVFASLGEHRPHQTASGIQAPVTAYADQEQDAFPFRRPAESAGAGVSGWDSEPDEEQEFGHGQDTDGFASAGGWPQDMTAREDAEAEADAPQGWIQGWQPEQEEAQASAESDLDAQLRAALQAHFPSHAAEAEPDPAPEPQFEQDDIVAEDGETVVPEALTAFWERPLPPPRDELEGGGAMPQEDEDELPPAGIVFDERLFRELEEGRDQVQQQPRSLESRGALALAAAWGLFLCIAGGLTAGLFGFREMAADALPGLAPFYRAVGMPVTVQPLIFEGIHYEWSVSEFKPVLHIKGAIYNRAHREVNVPDLVVSIKDDDPALDKEVPASLPVESGRIEPDQRAEFEIELVSPSSTITTVELQMRNVR